MRRVLKLILFSILGLIGIVIIALIIFFFSLSENYNPKATVVSDKSLAQIKLNNVKFHCETFGSDKNEVIIVLHGGPGGDYKNLLVLRELADKYFIVFYDQRGSGLSERVPIEKLNNNYFVQDLNAFVEHFSKKRRVTLIGHSWGGMLATAFTSKYPEKVNKLILVEPGGLSNEMLKSFMKKTGINSLKPTFNFLKHLITCWLKSLYVDGPDDYASEDFFIYSFIMDYQEKDHPLAGYYCNKEIPEVADDNWRFGALASKWVPQSALDSNGNYNIKWEDGLLNFNNDVLFIVGECDVILGEEFQRKQMKYFKNAILVSIPNTGHTMISESPQICIKIIRDFLNAEN